MALELSGAQQRQLRDALIDAFPSWSDLSQMLRFQLDENLAAVAAESKGLNTVAFELVGWARARGLLADLIVAARNEQPRNPRVKALNDLLGFTSVDEQTLQKIVNANGVFLDAAAWREGQARAETRVCRIDAGGDGKGTGILIGRDLVLTNYHVVESLLKAPATAPTWAARFDHKLADDGSDVIAGRRVAFAKDWDVSHAPYSAFDLEPDPKSGVPAADELDYALIRLAEPIGDQPVGKNDAAAPRSWISLSAQSVDVDAPRMIAILQHPRARPMKLSIGMVERLVRNTAGNRVRHGVPTEPGSSGSPLFDHDWNLIALHHSGDPDKVKPAYNEAIPIELIAARPAVADAVRDATS